MITTQDCKTLTRKGTKDAAKQKCRDYINSTRHRVNLKEEDLSMYRFFTESILPHNKKYVSVKDDIEFLFIDKCYKNKYNNAIYYKNIYDKPIENWSLELKATRALSWTKVFKKEETNEKNDLDRAHRTAVLEQTEGFKESSDRTCEICDCKHNLQTDHFEPRMEDLIINFYKETNHTPPKAFRRVEKRDNIWLSFKIEDNKIEEDWISYHKKNAKLRILCSYCNLTN